MALPVTLADAKAQLRLLGDLTPEQTTEINGFIRDAAGWVEKYTGHILEAREVTEQFTGVASVRLRAWPIAANTQVGVAYVDDDGQPVAPTGARLDVSVRPARVSPPDGPFWPFRHRDQSFAVTVRAGYENPADVPTNMRRAMLVMISAFDSDREGGEVFQAAEASARSLCRDYRNRRL